MDRFRKKSEVFQSSKRDGNGIGIESVRRILKKMGDQAASNIKMEFSQQRLYFERNLPELFCDQFVDY